MGKWFYLPTGGVIRSWWLRVWIARVAFIVTWRALRFLIYYLNTSRKHLWTLPRMREAKISYGWRHINNTPWTGNLTFRYTILPWVCKHGFCFTNAGMTGWINCQSSRHISIKIWGIPQSTFLSMNTDQIKYSLKEEKCFFPSCLHNTSHSDQAPSINTYRRTIIRLHIFWRTREQRNWNLRHEW